MNTHTMKPPKLRRYHIIERIGSKTFIPREYPVELLDSARNNNIVICLGVGSGKIFVALMLMKEFSHQVRKSLDDGGNRIVFLTPNAQMIPQHSKVIAECTDLTVGQYSGNETREWTTEKWKSQFDAHEIIVMLPDIFQLILSQNFIDMSIINLIIFDECSISQLHGYPEIISHLTSNSQKIPSILGLSSPLICNLRQPTDIERQIRKLEASFHSSVETANDLTSLIKYGSKPKELIIVYDHCSYTSEDLIELDHALTLIEKALIFLNDLKTEKEDEYIAHNQHSPMWYLIEIYYVILDLGLWCASKAIAMYIDEILFLLDNLKQFDNNESFLKLVITTLFMADACIQRVLSKYDLEFNLLINIPPKLKKLINILIPYKPAEKTNTSESDQPLESNTKVGETTNKAEANSNSDQNAEVAIKTSLRFRRAHKYETRSKRNPKNAQPEDANALCGLILVHQRITAYVLSEWLRAAKSVHSELSFVSPSYIVGLKRGFQKGSVTDYHAQEEVLQKFRTKTHNLVVAASIVEEGMDLPRCNLVVRFDPPENFHAYLQSKGRTKVNDSLYVLMVERNVKEAFDEALADYKAIEELLMRRCHIADIDLDEFVFDESMNNIMEPYIPVEDGAVQVSLSTAIAIVNRYCAKLPSDTFTRLTPRWKIRINESSDCQFQCVLKLPINSPVKKVIESPWMKSKQLSKMAAALKMCEELHKTGELDDKLMPTGKETIKSEDFFPEDVEEVSKHDEEAIRNYGRPGTYKRRLFYFKRVAEALRNSVPRLSAPNYLYVFDMKLTCPIPDEQNTRGRKIHDPSETVRRFGILTSKPIPPVCSFPVFTRSGEVTVKVIPTDTNIQLTVERLEHLTFFHFYTFSDVLRLEKYPMTYKPKDSEASFYVVPITLGTEGEFLIDWKFANLIYQQKSGGPRVVPDEERKSFEFKLEDFQDSVIMPWYRNLDKPQFFYVAEICSDLTPLSDFPDMEYKTFEEYYRKKYNINIMNHSQPLLDVDHTSARLNLLTPRYVNRKGISLPTSSELTKRTKRENLQQKQILIPELSWVHPFPGYLWRKAVCLPCILYRMNSLLLAEQLRLLVANSISVGLKSFPENFTWPGLDFGWTLADIIASQSQTDVKPENEEISQNGHLNNCTVNKNDNPASNMNSHSRSTSSKEISNCDDDFEIDVFDPNIVSNCEVDNVTNDKYFEIGIFDPREVHIPDDDELLEQELNQINFMNGNPSETDDMFGNDAFPLVRFPPSIRYGSPSNFETGWNMVEPFQEFRFQGLDSVNAPGFNVKSLSMDLTLFKDEFIYDSLEENSDSDEESCLPFGNSVKYQNDDAINDSPLTLEEIQEHSWITLPFYQSISTTINKCDVSEDIDDCESLVTEIKNQKKREFQYSDSDNCDIESNAGTFFYNTFQTVKNIQQALSLSSITASGEEEENYSLSDVSSKPIIKKEETLAFGELLPNRESHKLFDNMNRVSFDNSPDLSQYPGPSPSIILQALTMSNANDGINLERLETVGDSFLKYAITVYLYCMYPNIHEGKLSYLRSKQISNFNLYKLGRRKCLGEMMVASKFEPYDNWLPPSYIIPKGLEEALIESNLPCEAWNLNNWSDLTKMSEGEIRQLIVEKNVVAPNHRNASALIPYNLLTQHSIPDKSIADCVEALIGAYLVSCGSRGALLFMSWLGLRVLPTVKSEDSKIAYGFLHPPPSPNLARDPKSNTKLHKLLSGYAAFETKINYSFNDKSYLLQAFTHASYYYNTLTDCYQRLEFLGDAVLDYLITRHLYEDEKKHSPGTLTDLRSALVNNTFFASLAVKYDFHKFFKAISPALFNVINKFVQMKDSLKLEDYLEAYYLEEEECEEMEDIEVPKALGDIFESVAGAIYLDSNMSLDTVWRVYYTMMKPEIEYFSSHVPKSPIRELLELEPQTAKFEKAEMTVNGKVRVCVDVFGKGQFFGIGRNKRIAKCTAAKHALRELKKHKRM